MAIDESAELPFLPFADKQLFGDAEWQMQDAAFRFIGNTTFSQQKEWSFKRVTQGLSGGTVVRCSHPLGDFALKRWPATTTANRLDEIHRVQQFAGKSLNLVPELIPWRSNQMRLTTGNSNFDFARWKGGCEFNGGVGEVLAAVNRGAEAIARFHRSTVGLGVKSAIAPAVIQRIDRLASLKGLLPDAITRVSLHRESIRQAGKFLAGNWRLLQQKSESILQKWSDRVVPIQWVLRDIHREHVLFDQGEVTGMVDFDAVRRDTLATDLARWVGSFADLTVPNELLWSEAFCGYQSTSTISPCEQELASAIEMVNRYIQLANWVVWIAMENRTFPCGPEDIDRRVTRLLRICNSK